MQSSNIPDKIPVAWAEGAASTEITVIPDTSGTPGRASWLVGFPPLNFQPIDTGGIPPFGQDENGVLNALSLWLRWAQAGGPIKYDAVFSAAIGGYPLGALLQGDNLGDWWLSLVENNTSDPNAGGSDWYRWGVTVTPLYTAGGTADAWVIATDPATVSYNDGLTLGVVVATTNTTAVTIDAGGGAAQLRRNDGAQLQAGDVVANQNVLMVYDLAIGRFRLIAPVPSQLAGSGLKSNGAAAIRVDVSGLTAGSAVAVASLMMFEHQGTGVLYRTTAGAVAGLAVLSDQFTSEMQFWGMM